VGKLRSPGESNALKEGSANIAAIRLRRMINEAQSFYSGGGWFTTDVR
jgi:predicted nucleic acid-binding Zn ribbon protein